MKKKTARKFAAAVALLLASLMIVSVLASAIPYAQAASISGLQSQLSKIESQKKELQKEINALGDKIEVASDKKAALDEKIGLTQEEIDTTEALIDKLTDQIDRKEEELEVATAELDQKTELFQTRVRVMYEEGNASYLDVLLGAENLEDMLSRMDIVGQIMDYDKQVMEEYAAAKQDIADKKLSLEQDKGEQETFQESLQQKYSDLSEQRHQQQAVVESLNSDLEQKKIQSEKMEAERESINDEIAEMSRRAAEEARKKAASNGSTSGSTATMPSSGTFTWPLPGHGSGCITSNYGYRIHPISGKRKLHCGVDLGVPAGTKIVAAKGGTVVKSYMSSSYGNYTVIDHGGGIMTGYAHQLKRSVSVGDQVSAGQKIGTVGSTGNSTGNHLHFEVYVNGSTVNPMQFFN